MLYLQLMCYRFIWDITSEAWWIEEIMWDSSNSLFIDTRIFLLECRSFPNCSSTISRLNLFKYWKKEKNNLVCFNVYWQMERLTDWCLSLIPDHVLKQILPPGVEVPSSFETIGKYSVFVVILPFFSFLNKPELFVYFVSCSRLTLIPRHCYMMDC